MLSIVQASRSLDPTEVGHLKKRLDELMLRPEFPSEPALALVLGISQQTINKVRKGGSAGFAVARAVAKHLRMRPENLLAGEEPLVFPLEASKQAASCAQAVARYPGRWSVEVVTRAEMMHKHFPPGGWEAVLEAIAYPNEVRVAAPQAGWDAKAAVRGLQVQRKNKGRWSVETVIAVTERYAAGPPPEGLEAALNSEEKIFRQRAKKERAHTEFRAAADAHRANRTNPVAKESTRDLGGRKRRHTGTHD